MNRYDFGNRLCELRRAHGYTQQKLGKMLGVSNKAVSKWENGESMPRLQMLDKIAECFDLSVDELMDYTGITARQDESAEAEATENETEAPIIKRILSSKGFKLLLCVLLLLAIWIKYYSEYSAASLDPVDRVFTVPIVFGLPFLIVSVIVILAIAFAVANDKKKCDSAIIIACFLLVALPILIISIQSKLIVDKLYIRNDLFDKYDIHAFPSLPELDYSKDASMYDMFVVSDSYGFETEGIARVKLENEDETVSIDYHIYEFKAPKLFYGTVRKQLLDEYSVFISDYDEQSGECNGFTYEYRYAHKHFDEYYYYETPSEWDVDTYSILTERDNRIAVVRLTAHNCEPFDAQAIAEYLCSYEYFYEGISK